MSRYVVVVILFFLLLSGGGLNAQILHLHKLRAEHDTSKVWYGDIELGFLHKNQQVNVTEFHSRSNLDYVSDDHNYLLVSNFSLVKVGTNNVLSEGFSHMRANLYQHNTFSPEVFFQVQYDIGRGMEERTLVGSSAKMQVFHTDKVNYSVNTGFMYEHEVWRNPENSGRKIDRDRFKSTTNMSLKWEVTETANLHAIAYYQATVNEFFSPRISMDMAFKFFITRQFSFKNEFQFLYDADPVIDVARFISTYRGSLVFRFL